MSDKKFFPKLYPLNRDINKLWFISYRTIDWKTGKHINGKYAGLLNRLPTVEERIALAETYMQLIKQNLPLPNVQGRKDTAQQIQSSEKTNIIFCCDRFQYLCANQEMKPATLAQYKSKFRVFYKWLQKTNRHALALGGFTDTDAQDFMIYLSNEKKLCGHTYNAYKILLSRVWQLYRKQVTESPWQEIKSRKNNTVHLKSYDEGLRKFIAATLPAYNPQLWLFMQCVYYCAIRPGAELRKLKIKHIDFKRGLFMVPSEISKTGKYREVNICAHLMRQLKKAGFNTAPAEDFIFSKQQNHGPMLTSKNHFIRMWDAYRKHFSIDKTYKLYGSKHTGGKALTMVSNAFITKEHFGHTQMETTQSYINDVPANELKMVQKIFPKF